MMKTCSEDRAMQTQMRKNQRNEKKADLWSPETRGSKRDGLYQGMRNI